MLWRLWVPPIVMSIFLIVVARHSFLGFHTFAELFAIVISFVMFAFAWSTYSFSRNNFLLFLACGYFWIGFLDLMHTLTYKGMNVFVEGSGNLAVQFWIGSRYGEALLMLMAPFAATRKQNGYLLITAFGAFAVGLTTIILSGNFPVGFVEGTGLTSFKIYSEYLIILILALALVTLFRQLCDISPEEKIFISTAIVMTMCAELAFTFYVSVYGLSNLAGHIFKLLSYWFILQAIVISNLKRPYALLENSETRYRETVERTNDLITVVDKDGLFEFVNHSANSIFGVSAEDCIGLRAFDFVHPEDRARTKKTFQGWIENKETSVIFENRQVSRDGNSHDMMWNVSLHYDENGEIASISGIARDLTERKQIEGTLRKLSLAVEQSPSSVIITNTEGTIEYVNKMFTTITGYSAEEAIGQKPSLLKSGETPEEVYETLWAAINKGKQWRGTLRNKRKDGSVYLSAATISPIVTSDGAVTHFIGATNDITQRVADENKLKQSEKLESIGGLAGGIAHDFNNMLLPIISLTDLTRKGFPEESRDRQRLDKVVEAANRAKDLVARILAFSRQENANKQNLDLNATIKNTLELLRATLPTTVKIVERLEKADMIVFADQAQISSVLMNLSTNAADAMNGQAGEMKVSLSPIKVSKNKAASIEDLNTGKYAKLVVKDCGHGMDQKTLDRIKDPFFTTKEVGKGTGLGLSMVHGIVAKHGGAIDISSTPGKGTTIEIYLPISEGESVDAHKSSDNSRHPEATVEK